MSTKKTVPERVLQATNEYFHRLQSIENSVHDWADLRDAMYDQGNAELYFAFQNWQDEEAERILG